MYLDLNKRADYVLCGYKRFAKDEFHVTRISREDILILMLDGTLYFTEQGNEVAVKRGEYYIQKVGMEQSATRSSDDAHYIYIHFKGSWCEDGIHVLPTRGSFNIEKIYRTADWLCRASLSRSEPFVSVARAFNQIFEMLLQDNRLLDDGLLVAEKIHKYISENFARAIMVSELAERFSYSPDYVIRVFKRAYQTTPHKYMTLCRIEYAKALLSTTDLPISEVAEACGYADFTTFFRAFRAHTSCSPSDWRSGRQEKSELVLCSLA